MKKIESHVASFVLILAVLFCCPCHGQDTPVPAEAELKKVNSLINELFRKQISAAKEPEELVAIAKELRYSALEAGEKPQHYGLLKKAIELAGLAGDVTLGVAYIELLDDEFDIDLKQETLDLLGECSSGKRDATDFGVLATHIAGMIDGEIPTQDTGYLKKLASVGSKIASKSKDKELIQRFKDYKKSISALAKMAANLEAARNKVKTTPDDAAANKVLGEHYCLVKQDWDVGLGYLAKATGLLGEIAKLEKSAPSEPEKQQELARAWVKYSGASKGFEDESIARARDWHEKAIANLSGFKKKRAQLELSELKEVAVKVVSRTPRRVERYVISAGFDNTIRVWDVRTGDDLHVTKIEPHIRAVAMSPAGKVFASGSGDRIVNIWKLVSGKNVHRLEGHPGGIFSLIFSPDGKSLASGDRRGAVRIWDSQTGKQSRKFQDLGGKVKSLDWHPNGSQIAAAISDGTVRLLDPQTGATSKIDAHPDKDCRGVHYSPNGKRLASAGDDSKVRIWNPKTRKHMGEFVASQTTVNRVQFSPDGKHIATASDDSSVRIWSADNFKPVAELKGHIGYVIGLRYSPSGRIIASSGFDDKVILWDTQTGNKLFSYDKHTGDVWGLDFGL